MGAGELGSLEEVVKQLMLRDRIPPATIEVAPLCSTTPAPGPRPTTPPVARSRGG